MSLRVRLWNYMVKHGHAPTAILAPTGYAGIDPEVRTLAGIPVAIDPNYWGEPLFLEPEEALPATSLPTLP